MLYAGNAALLFFSMKGSRPLKYGKTLLFAPVCIYAAGDHALTCSCFYLPPASNFPLLFTIYEGLLATPRRPLAALHSTGDLNIA